jgi:hypothetical protein
MKVLDWKVCRNPIATQVNMSRRGMATTAIRQICGCEPEDTFHVFGRSPLARALREVWELPSDRLIVHTGDDWLLHLLCSLSETQQAMTLMTIWRVWDQLNELTHDKPCPPVEGSRRFLVSYLNSGLMIKQRPNLDVVKEKMVVSVNEGFSRQCDQEDG